MRPTVFVGSSAERRDIARNIRAQLKEDAEVTIWDEVFSLGRSTLESLIEKLDTFDFAIFVLSADDLTVSREQMLQSPRDNVLFECGLFTGKLGRDRTFVIFDKDSQIKMPSDLAGITLSPYRGSRTDGNITAAVGEACDLIGETIRRLGPRRELAAGEAVSLKSLLSEVRGGFTKIDANIHQVRNIIQVEREVPDSVFTQRAGHYKEEKAELAGAFLDQVLGPRVQYLRENMKDREIRIILDSGTTIAPILNAMGKQAEESENYWCKDVPVITNNIQGIENMLRYREHRKNRYAQLPIRHVSVLPGKILAAYEAIADEATLKALASYRHDGGYTIAVTTGNYILLHRGDFAVIARAGFHPDFKATLYDVADEVYIVAPLGKLLTWTGRGDDGDAVGSIKELLEMLNQDLNLKPCAHHVFDESCAYDLITESEDESTGSPNQQGWLSKSVLVTTSRLNNCLFFGHFQYVQSQVLRNFQPNWRVGTGPRLAAIPFNTLPISLGAQLHDEVPHDNLRAHKGKYFVLPTSFQTTGE